MKELHLVPGKKVDAGGTWPVVKVGITAAGQGIVELLVREQDRTALDGLIAKIERPVRWAVDTSVGPATVVLLEQDATDMGNLLRKF